MSDKNTSTLQSYVDQASGAMQSALGSITGNNADKSQGENRKAAADAKDDLSHTGGTLGGLSFSSTGVAANDPNRTTGSYNQTMGSAKEAIGSLTGMESMRSAGERQNQEGKGQEAQGQLSDLGGGMADRAKGAVGGAFHSLTGDEEGKARAERQHDQGKTLQRGVESELDKKADAQRY
ncbi:hypothetical protein BAUCODRAFT_31509 [Baudoinia panamericana UAMH 10762]|uniref:CsbD-like domain-containing protein n=1 Tax=Baudoinia panamericana (strain UAMH 10762) TaxID=717646 RepID=M2N582_BAUPA|nr:uncharacterized protein BAUCODRAFT_31509 [Baudoinia panamericana UAMH 10762]EMC99178.1 hypothetical protein BAUCODRAFT_31509 [Baudoinia panamericana UAMH 10762]